MPGTSSFFPWLIGGGGGECEKNDTTTRRRGGNGGCVGIEKEWTHHGLLLISGLHQIAEWSAHEKIKTEQNAQGRNGEVKVRNINGVVALF